MNAAARRLPGLGAMLSEGLSATFGDVKGLLGYALPLTVVIAAVWSYSDLTGKDLPTATNVFIEIGLAYTAFYWQRRYLLGPEATSPRGDDARELSKALNRQAGRYVVRAAGLYLVLGVAGLLLSIPLVSSLLEQERYEEAIVFAAPVFLILIIPAGPFLLVFPSIAAGKPIGWGQSWRLARGRGFRLGVLALLCMLPIVAFTVAFALFVPMGLQDSPAGAIVVNVAIAALRVLGMLVALTAAAFLYRCATEPTDLSAFD